MGIHDRYGKAVLAKATEGMAETEGASVAVPLGRGVARIDASVGNFVAVEIESRTSKQVRGAVLDLLFHPSPKKLLILLPCYMHDVEVTREQCEFILGRWLNRDNFRVIVLEGHGGRARMLPDAALVASALRELGWLPSSPSNS